MPDAFDAKTRYYAVTLSNRATSQRKTPWVWSPPKASVNEAAELAKAALAAGDASQGYVVRVTGDTHEVVRIYPTALKRAIDHYEELLELLGEEEC